MTDALITHVVGARPNLVKAAPVLAALAGGGVRQRLVHTGQHYDDRLSEVFFRELALPAPDANLGIGSGTHAEQTAAALVGVERDLLAHRPALVVVYGDVNSTLAAALAAAKLGVPVAHVEAGLRSFDPTMPEELNRRLTDAVADLLFVTSAEGVDHLRAEGVDGDAVHLVGNPMIDTLRAVAGRLDPAPVLAAAGLDQPAGPPFGLVTLHRPGNVDDPARAAALVEALDAAAERLPLVVPLHPRGRQRLVAAGLRSGPRLVVTDPLGYLDFTALLAAAAVVVTDSGGVQEESTVLGVPCLTVRPNTERPITVTAGTNRLVEPPAVPGAVDAVLAACRPLVPDIPLWDGAAAGRIARIVRSWLGTRG